MRRVSARRSPNVREARMSGNGCVSLYRRAAHRPRADRKGRRPKTGGGAGDNRCTAAHRPHAPASVDNGGRPDNDRIAHRKSHITDRSGIDA
ncbi:hypothetical protein F5D26_03105 [Burkholderia pseudomallei]|nr:hypothetical protein F5D26_03105 [Burkholderia pseudomallei]